MMSRESSDKEYIRRFGTYRIVEHLSLIALFVILAATGLPQKFHTLSLSQFLIIAMGGINTVRVLHHAAGALFAGLALQHILTAFIGVAFFHWEPSMLITFKDAHDALHNTRYCLGLVGRPAISGKYAYKEKFIYWLVLSGGIQMILTGLLLWFPVTATKHLPGQLIPAAKVVHTNEAMLIFLLMVLWHILDSMFTEGASLNKSIFTGYIEKERTEPERPVEQLQRTHPQSD